MTACSEIVLDGPDAPSVEQGVSRKFTFALKGDFQNPTFTRAGEMTANGVEMTDLWVVDVQEVERGDVAGREVVQMLHQVPTDEGWGKPKMSLTLGKHHIMFLASRGQGAMYEDGVVTWTKPLDTFFKDYEVEVKSTSNGNRAVTLERCVAKLSLVINDAIPSDVNTVTLSASRWSRGWDMVHARPTEMQYFENAFNMTGAHGAAGVSLNIYSLAGENEWTSRVDVSANSGAGIVSAVTIEAAPFVVNRATVYRGNLFTNSQENGISLADEWKPDYEGVY